MENIYCFKLTLSLPVQHLIPYYAEIFLASSLILICGDVAVLSLAVGVELVHRRTGPALGLTLYAALGLALTPHRKSDL